jgi:hypothetical protein
MLSSFYDVRGAGAVKWTLGWFVLVFLTVRLAAADTSIEKPTVIPLTGVIGSLDIQKALNSLPATGGEVDLPVGKIEIRQPIVLDRDHETLRGAGSSTILYLADNANCPVIIMGKPVNNPTGSVTHLLVANLFIDGNRIHQDRELWKLSGEGSQIRNNGITVQGVTDSTVQNVAAARCRSGGLVTTRDIRRLTVNGFESFENQFDGLACYQTEDSLFTDLHLHNNPGAGISLDLAFDHNVISNALLVANDLGIFMRSSRENEFANVTIRDSHHHGVFMAHTDMRTANGWGPAPNTECVYNKFTNLVAMNCGGAAFRVNNTTCTNNIIIRAQFAGNVKGGLSLAQPDMITVR